MTKLIWAWIVRRGMEVGGIVGVILTAYLALPEATQQSIMRLLSKEWGDVTLGSLWPAAIALWGYVWSFRSTVRSQVVVDKEQVPIRDIQGGGAVAEKARTAVEKKAARPNILERIFGRR